MAVLTEVQIYLQRFKQLTEFLRGYRDLAQARALLEETMARREENFLTIAERAIYPDESGIYRRLLLNAGIGPADLRRMVNEDGLENALERLHDAGVYLTVEESKGLQPVKRNGLEFLVRQSDFVNPLVNGTFEWTSSGSRRGPVRNLYAKEYLEHDAAYFPLTLAAFGIEDRTVIGWRPETHEFAKYYARFGKTPERWFTQRRRQRDAESLRAVLLDLMAFIAARRAGRPLPWPKFVHRQEALVVARWLAARKRRGAAALVDTNVSSSVRVCLAAQSNGLDISGTVFRVGGEPYTPAKAEVLARAGTSAIDFYGTAEMSWIGLGCARGRTQDDIHMATDKIAVFARERTVAAGISLNCLYFTSLLPNAPKLILNVECGDYGTLEERDCGCMWQGMGFTTHLVGLRSHEKLTSEGVTFLGGEILELLEEVLPSRFGGSPIDYQLVEEEEGGLPKVSVIVAPGVGPVDEAAVIGTILETLGARPGGGSLMSDQWRQGKTLRLVRREPYVTATSKVLPLHILRSGSNNHATGD